MTTLEQHIKAGGDQPPAMVTVWDPFVRVFHWTLVILFAVAFLSGDDFETLHIATGYALLALIGMRVVWGFIGTRHARFSDFVRGPSEVMTHLRDMLRFRARRYIGHNPAGGAMVIALLLALLGTGASGFLMTTDAFWDVKWVEEVHEALAYATLGLVILHVIGVLAASLEQRENLIQAMLSGRKRAG